VHTCKSTYHLQELATYPFTPQATLQSKTQPQRLSDLTKFVPLEEAGLQCTKGSQCHQNPPLSTPAIHGLTVSASGRVLTLQKKKKKNSPHYTLGLCLQKTDSPDTTGLHLTG
jgi:hypothetical protein